MDTKIIRSCIGLLKSMISSGEHHSKQSNEAIKEAIDELKSHEEYLARSAVGSARSSVVNEEPKMIKYLISYISNKGFGSDYININSEPDTEAKVENLKWVIESKQLLDHNNKINILQISNFIRMRG